MKKKIMFAHASCVPEDYVLDNTTTMINFMDGTAWIEGVVISDSDWKNKELPCIFCGDLLKFDEGMDYDL